MYWCCGSKHQDEPGCKFSKHINKDAEKEEDQSDEDESDQLKKQLCICCKKLGHKEENCPMDPNFRDKKRDVETEMMRIQVADSDLFIVKKQMESTLNFMKELVSTKKEPEEPPTPEGEEEEEEEEWEPMSKQ